jgi:hypothetical protein
VSSLKAKRRELLLKRIEIKKELLRRKNRAKQQAPGGLYEFVKYFWPILEPKTKFVDGWAIRAICAHLEAVTRGDITRLLINVPPGFSKSLICNVFFPAWEWGPMGLTSMRYIAFSYGSHLTERDNGKFRDIIQSKKFQELWGDKFKTTGVGVVKVSNDKTGWKFASSVGGVGTGERADRVLCDDPHNLADGESDVIRVKTVRWFDEAMSNRLNDLQKSAIIVIMQRVNECLLPDSGILSDMSIIRADEIRAGDPVVTSQGIQKVVAVASRDYVGETISIRASGYCEPLRVTSNHPILTSDGWVEAGKLTRSHQLIISVDQRQTTTAELQAIWPKEDEDVPATFRGTTTGTRTHLSKEIFQPLVDAGHSSREIAEIVGLKYRQQVDQYLVAFGIAKKKCRSIDEAILADPRFWRFVGYWLAEGCIGEGRTRLSRIVLTFHKDELDYVQDIRDLFADYGIPVHLSFSKFSTANVFITSYQVAKFLNNFGTGALNKCLPDWAVRLDPEFLRELVIGYWRGDGSTIGNTARIGSVSLALLSSLQRAMLRMGIVAGVLKGQTGKGGICVIASGPQQGREVKLSTNQAYELRFDFWSAPWLCDEPGVRPRYKANRLSADGKQLFVRISNIERSTYAGKVYDLETPCHDFVCGLITAHNCDVSGHVIENEDDYVHLLIPMEFDGRVCQTCLGRDKNGRKIIWEDPRTEIGELAWPERYGENVLQRFRRNAFMWAGQYQQTPEPRGGGLFKRDWWQYIHVPIGAPPPPMEYVVASLDSAYTKNERNDPSGFTVWGAYVDERDNPKIMMLGAWRKHLEIHGADVEREPGEHELDYKARAKKEWGLVEWVAHECKRHHVDMLLIEAKASGIDVGNEMRRLYANEGWGVELIDPKGGDKYARAVAQIHLFADGMVGVPVSHRNPKDRESELIPRDWAQLVIDETAMFPNGRFKDLTDSTTQALKHLRQVGFAIRRDERDQVRAIQAQHGTTRLDPLYEV